jgi:pimeloyl-ACP methyl ester carboxylesterase
MLRIILRVLGSLILLALITLVIAWFYFDEEHLDLNAETRAQMDETFIKLADGMIHYELSGPEDGELVVLVHGFSVPSYIWQPTFELLTSAGYRVLRFDAFGRGHSDRPDVDYSVTFFAESVNKLTEALNIRKPFTLIGLSMGGPVTTFFTNQHPGKVKRLVLIDPMVFAPSKEEVSVLAKPIIGAYLVNVYLIPQIAAGQTSDFHDREQFPGWVAQFRDQMQYRGFRRSIVSTLLEFDSDQILGEYEKLGNSDIPVKVFWGREDQTVPLEFSNKLLELIPQARLTVIDEAGHLPHYERSEVFNPLLLEYLQSTP